MQHSASPVLRAVALVVWFAACDGSLREKPGQGGTEAPLGVQAPECGEALPPDSDGYHHPGEDCLMCHYQGGEGPPYSFAGTLYADTAGNTPVAGATIHIVDQMGYDAMVTTASNGNFWSYDPVGFPSVAFASLCPDVTPMLTPLGETDGSCNKSGCHTANFRVTVP